MIDKYHLFNHCKKQSCDCKYHSSKLSHKKDDNKYHEEKKNSLKIGSMIDKIDPIPIKKAWFLVSLI